MRRPFAFGVRVRGQWVVTVLALAGCEERKRFVVDNEEDWKRCLFAAYASPVTDERWYARKCAVEIGAGHWEELP